MKEHHVSLMSRRHKHLIPPSTYIREKVDKGWSYQDFLEDNLPFAIDYDQDIKSRIRYRDVYLIKGKRDLFYPRDG